MSPPLQPHQQTSEPLVRNPDGTIKFEHVPDDCVVFDGDVYFVPDTFVSDHPGGDVVKAHFGRDVSVHYRMMHAAHTSDGKLLKESCVKIGTLGAGEASKFMDYEFQWDSPLFIEIKAAVEKIVPRHKQFAPPVVWVHYFFVILATVGLRVYWAWTGGSWLQALILGCVLAHSYLTILHSSGHYQNTDKRGYTLNRAMQMITGCTGYTPIAWFLKHQEHHAFTQHAEYDPDMAMNPALLRSKENCEEYKGTFGALLMQFQWVYIHILGFFLFLSHLFGDFNPAKGRQVVGLNKGPGTQPGWRNNEWIQNRVMQDQIVKFVFGIGFFVFPVLWTHGLVKGMLMCLLCGGVGGSILVLTFSPNHSFKGIVSIRGRKAVEGDKLCWAKLQIEGSNNFGGSFMAFLTGSLNYQIEHHLFPRMHAHWYPKIAPEVRRICLKHGVNYSHFPTLTEAWVGVIDYYWGWGKYLMGKEEAAPSQYEL